MSASQRHSKPASLKVRANQPLIGVIEDEDGTEVVRYSTDEAAADQATPGSVDAALSVIGAWSDLDFDEMLDQLDRIRHESPPTPPLALD
jgi:hypothetical protein